MPTTLSCCSGVFICSGLLMATCNELDELLELFSALTIAGAAATITDTGRFRCDRGETRSTLAALSHYILLDCSSPSRFRYAARRYWYRLGMAYTTCAHIPRRMTYAHARRIPRRAPLLLSTALCLLAFSIYGQDGLLGVLLGYMKIHIFLCSNPADGRRSVFRCKGLECK